MSDGWKVIVIGLLIVLAIVTFSLQMNIYRIQGLERRVGQLEQGR